MPAVDNGPPDEIEPGQVAIEELERLVHHPHQELRRLHDIAEAGETGSAAFITIGRVAVRVVPIVLAVMALTLTVYYAAR